MTKTTHIHWTNTLLSGVLSRAHYDHSFTPSLTFWESSQPAPRRCGLPGLAETAWSPVSRCGLKQRNESFTDNFTGHTEVKWSNWNSQHAYDSTISVTSYEEYAYWCINEWMESCPLFLLVMLGSPQCLWLTRQCSEMSFYFIGINRNRLPHRRDNKYWFPVVLR